MNTLIESGGNDASLVGPPVPVVLIVDDVRPCRMLLGEILTAAGYRCQTAGSGEEALACCLHERPSVLVTDFKMPGLDGATLAGSVVERHPGLPVILVTGHDPEEPELVAIRSRFVAILVKPIEPDRLIRLLGRLLAPAESLVSSSRLP